MVSTSQKILQLRQLLSEKFAASSLTSPSVYRSGIPAVDEVGVPGNALTEVLSSDPGGTLLFYSLLHFAAQRRERVIVVDGKDCFQPNQLPKTELKSVLWARCATAKEALQVVDLVSRDGNFSLILLLLTLNPLAELRRISSNIWHRLQRLVEKSAVPVIVFTPFPQVSSARLRLSIKGNFSLEQLHCMRAELLNALTLEVSRCRMGKNQDDWGEESLQTKNSCRIYD